WSPAELCRRRPGTEAHWRQLSRDCGRPACQHRRLGRGLDLPGRPTSYGLRAPLGADAAHQRHVSGNGGCSVHTLAAGIRPTTYWGLVTPDKGEVLDGEW